MKFSAKKVRLFLLIILGILVLALPLYIASKRYILYRNSLDYYISRSYGDLISTSQANKELAQTILKDDKLQKYQALLFDKQFEDIIISLDGFANIANAIDKKNNYNTILTVVSHSPYGGNFTVFKGTDRRQLNNDDKAFLNEVISIDNIIINASPISTSDRSRVPYIKNDSWFNWFKQVYENIMQGSSQFLKLYDASLSLTVSDEDSKPLAGAKIVIINENGDVIGILTSDKNGHAEKKLTVPVDRRYFDFVASRGTVTAIAYKKGYRSAVIFQIPVNSSSMQPFFMNLNSSNTDNSDTVLGMNLDNDLNSLAAKYMPH